MKIILSLRNPDVQLEFPNLKRFGDHIPRIGEILTYSTKKTVAFYIVKEIIWDVRDYLPTQLIITCGKKE
jgi:hypothetical protein